MSFAAKWLMRLIAGLLSLCEASEETPRCIFAGASLRTRSGAEVGCRELGGKSVALYFAGEWCPLCRRFTPALRSFHEQYRDTMQVVFVSSDTSQDDAQAHFESQQGNWLALGWGDSLAAELKRRYGVWSMREAGEFGMRGRRAGARTASTPPRV
mmetsp:Transcript_7331/g.24173  ORF Transcript_7331/g.24173 Transcript_7331/m.24173 type:complete len:155 (+) Transcript_7331:54-518(+)